MQRRFERTTFQSSVNLPGRHLATVTERQIHATVNSVIVCYFPTNAFLPVTVSSCASNLYPLAQD